MKQIVPQLLDLIRSICNSYLQTSSKKKKYTILNDLGKMNTKYGKTGPKDLSTSYKEYLYGDKSKHTI